MTSSFKNSICPAIIAALLLAMAACGGDARDGQEQDSATATTAEHDHAATQDAGRAASGMLPDLTGGTAALGDGLTLYTCGMHPQVISEEPGNCPICGMRLVPVNPTARGGEVVEIDPGTIQTIGVRTTTVTVAPLTRTVRATGRFVMDEKGAHTVTLKTGGWIERLHVDFAGAVVRKGQPMLELYSPELVTTQQEYLLALATAERMRGTTAAGAEQDAQRVLDAARRRLAYFDLTEEQIARIESTGEVVRTVTYPVPASGEVMEKAVVEGQQVAAGEPLMKIFDTSEIWLVADIYEQDLPWVSVGSHASISVPYFPDRRLEGRIEHLYYMLNPETRSIEARITLQRADKVLRPGMYAVVELDGTPTESGPVVPEEAIIWTGDQSVVILSVGSGRFRPVAIRTGVQADGFIQVLDGLVGGEEVVTSAQFLIDSEARLKSAISAMVGSHDHAGTAGSPSGGSGNGG
jgi:RND family efflux transporter MFP subunit